MSETLTDMDREIIKRNLVDAQKYLYSLACAKVKAEKRAKEIQKELEALRGEIVMIDARGEAAVEDVSRLESMLEASK